MAWLPPSIAVKLSHGRGAVWDTALLFSHYQGCTAPVVTPHRSCSLAGKPLKEMQQQSYCLWQCYGKKW